MSTLTPVKIPVDVLHRIVVLVVAKLCGLAVSRRQSSPLGSDVGEATGGRSVRVVVLVVDKASVDSLCPCRHPGVPTLVKLPRNVLCRLRP